MLSLRYVFNLVDRELGDWPGVLRVSDQGYTEAPQSLLEGCACCHTRDVTPLCVCRSRVVCAWAWS